MINPVILLILFVSIISNGLGTVYANENVTEEIYKMFSNLTPDYLGSKNFSYEYSEGFSISSMPSINTSNSSNLVHNNIG